MKKLIMDSSRFEKILLLFILVLFGVYFLNIGSYGLIDPDEGRYAEVAREMVESGDYITPHLNYVKFFDKPALSYWLTSMAFHVFGFNEFASRFSPVVLALIGMCVLFRLATKIYNRRAGLISALVAGTSFLYFVISHITITDMPLSFFVTLSLAGFYIGYLEKSRHYLFFYCGMALAVLSKGLIGIIFPCGIIFWWIVLTRKWRVFREVLSLKGILLFFLISLPWFVAVSSRNPDFFHYFFIRQHFTRFLTTADNRYEPFWFFIPIILVGIMPWTGFLLKFLKEAVFSLRENAGREKEGELFLLLWFAIIFIFFSMSSSKLVTYIIPAFSPLAVLIGGMIDRILQEKDRERAKGIFAWNFIFLFLYGLLFLVLPFVQKDYPLQRILPVCISIFLAFFAGIIFTYSFSRKKNMEAIIIVFVLLGVINCIEASTLMGLYAERHTSRYVSEFINSQQKPGDLVVQLRGFDPGLSFYLKQRIVLLSHSEDMKFGDEHEKDRSWFIDMEGLKELWKGDDRIFLIACKDQEKDIENLGGEKITALATFGRKQVYSNRSLSVTEQSFDRKVALPDV